jgi:hypothetical protein
MSEAKTLQGYSACEESFAFSNADAEVVLANIADYGSITTAETLVRDLVYSWRPDAIFTNGDNTYSAAFDYATSIGGYYGEFVARNLLWPCPGNHDWDDGTLVSYMDYFSGVASYRYYYKKVFGPVSVYFLDSNYQTPDGNTDSGEQYDWLVNELVNTRSTWNIVTRHHPAWGSSLQYGGVETQRWDLEGLGVDIVINGHAHLYERVLKDTYYITNGAGGSALYSFATPIEGSQVRYNSMHGAGKIIATPNKLVWQFHSYDGALVDRLELEK